MADANLLMNIQNLPSDIKIYAYNGHGEDICDNTGEAIIRQVPEGCIYVTLEECGDLGYYQEERISNFQSRDPITKATFKYPYIFLNELSDKVLPRTNVKRTSEAVKLHLPGDNYAVSKLFPFGYWYDRDSIGFAISGLVEKEMMEAHPQTDYPNNKFGTIKDDGLKPIIKRDIVRYFQASVYPTPEQVTEALVPMPDIVIPKSINEGAIYCDRIKNTIEEELGVFDGISKKDGPDAFLSNTYMMEKFPGIHYNFVCRSMNKECEDKKKKVTAAPIRRRAQSINENALRRDILLYPSVQDKIMTYILNNHELHPAVRKNLEDKRDI